MCESSLYSARSCDGKADVEARRMRCLVQILNLIAKAFLYGTSADSFELELDNLITLRQSEADY
jgi:hypothetical protein